MHLRRLRLPDVHNWGSTEAERARPFPCDRHLDAPASEIYRAVDVAAPPEIVFRWLCQLRVAPYSYDWLDNRGRRSPRELTPGLERLEIGQRVMTIFKLAEFEPGRSLTLTHTGGLFGRVAITYSVHDGSEPGSSRLLVKLLWSYPGRGSRRALLSALLPAGDLVMMRKQLLTLKRLAESAATG